MERGQRPGLPEPGQGDLGSCTFPGPEHGARNSSPGVGVRAASPRAAPPPWDSQSHRDMDCRTPDLGSGDTGSTRGSPLPQIRAEARHSRARAHGAAAPLDPGLGAPWEAGGRGRPGLPPPLPAGSAASARPGAAGGARTRCLGSTSPTTLALHPTPSAHEAMRLQLEQGQVTPPCPSSIQGLPAAEGLGAEGPLEGPGP